MSSDAEVGWIAAIIIGGIAGWLAEQFMKSGMGLLMNIVLGVVGAAGARGILRGLWNRARRMDRLPDPWVYRRLSVDLDRSHGPRRPHGLSTARRPDPAASYR